MAIYGWNFNNSPIPMHIRERFAERKRYDGEWFLLQGVCNETAEQEAMGIQMHNGTRKWHWEKRQAVGKVWYGCYVR